MPAREELEEIVERTGGEPKKTPQPSWMQPMLATLLKERFYGAGWIYERKLDGERCLTYKKAGSLMMYSRNRKLINHSYPELVEALQKQPVPEFVIDGEIVALRKGQTSFELLQNRMHVLNPNKTLLERVPVYYYIFDIMHLNGYELVRLPLLYRKKILKDALDFKGRLRYLAHTGTADEEYFQWVCGEGWEGLIAKRSDSIYRAKRSTDWLKFKCINEEEFVIGGYTDPQKSRTGFGSILVGYYDAGKLKYAGKIGTGFNERTLKSLCETFRRMSRPQSPFIDFDPNKREFHWVEPKLVAQVSFTEWTSDGKLRHPSFMGLRDDKKPAEVVRET